MPKFFIDKKPIENIYTITGENAKHIIKSLRMKEGEEITLCNNYIDYYGKISKINKNEVILDIFKECKNDSEPKIKLNIFMAYPKSSKIETIIQKVTELGAFEVTPFISENTVVKLDEKERIKKVERLDKISKSAASQSNRGGFVKINDIISFDECIKRAKNYECKILFYEKVGKKIDEVDLKKSKNICIFIGSEGGFSEHEVALAKDNGFEIINLGKRILRCETAAIVGCSLVMFLSGNMYPY